MLKFPAGVSPYSLPGMRKEDLPISQRTYLPGLSQKAKMELVAEIVCDFYEITKAQLQTELRVRTLVDARKIFTYLVRRYFKLPLTTIGKFLDRDHTTVIFYGKAIQDMIDTDPVKAREIQFLSSKLFDQ